MAIRGRRSDSMGGDLGDISPVYGYDQINQCIHTG